MIKKNTRLFAILLTASLLLLIPLIAMKFTNEVNWDSIDFAVAAVLLFGTGLVCEFVLRKFTKTKTRIIICGTIIVAFILVWAELAVGIFGTPFAGN